MKPTLLLLLFLAACKPEVVATPDPVPLTAEAVGHYCQMDLLEHPGPKAQVHLDGLPGQPLFFSQVRDAVAYTRLPEQSHTILAVYVNDMGAAPSWEQTGPLNWIAAESAVYVVGSVREGGMGAPELVPFSVVAKAEAFAAENGGKVLALDAIPDEAVMAPVMLEGDIGAGDDDDYAARLRKLTQKAGG